MAFVNGTPWKDQPWNDEDNDENILGPWNAVEWGGPEEGEETEEPYHYPGGYSTENVILRAIFTPVTVSKRNITYNMNTWGDPTPARKYGGAGVFVTNNMVYEYNICIGFRIGYGVHVSYISASISDDGIIGDWILYAGDIPSNSDVPYGGLPLLTLNKVYRSGGADVTYIDGNTGRVISLGDFHDTSHNLFYGTWGDETITITQDRLYNVSSYVGTNFKYREISCDGTLYGAWQNGFDYRNVVGDGYGQSDQRLRFQGLVKVFNSQGGRDKVYAFTILDEFLDDEGNRKPTGNISLFSSCGEIDEKTGDIIEMSPLREDFFAGAIQNTLPFLDTSRCLPPIQEENSTESYFIENYSFFAYYMTYRNYAVYVNGERDFTVGYNDDRTKNRKLVIVSTKNRIYIFFQHSRILYKDYNNEKLNDTYYRGWSVIIIRTNRDASIHSTELHENVFFCHNECKLKPVITSSRLYMILYATATTFFYTHYPDEVFPGQITNRHKRYFKKRDTPYVCAIYVPFKGGKNSYLDCTYDDEKEGCVEDGLIVLNKSRIKITGSIRVTGEQPPNPVKQVIGRMTPPIFRIYGRLRQEAPVVKQGSGHVNIPSFIVRGSIRATRTRNLRGRYVLPRPFRIRGQGRIDDDWVLRFKREEVL